MGDVREMKFRGFPRPEIVGRPGMGVEGLEQIG